MLELTKTVVDMAEQRMTTNEDLEDAKLAARFMYPELHKASKLWAQHALNTYEGELLKKALAVSAALSDFAAGNQRGED